MHAQIIPLFVVSDVAANIEYLERTLGFRLHREADGGHFAVMEYRGAHLMLQSKRFYSWSRDVSLEDKPLGLGIEILIRVRGVEEVYAAAVANDAVVSRHLHSIAESLEYCIRRFSAALPDGYAITFHEYVHTDIY